ncbi:hypothetical protein PS1M3_39420 (plasmid) [Pseudoalteromonas sp. PS1M3]|nr:MULTISPECIES: hypothetical protein [unclassified Pseudoalteromonas]BBW93855.1 hypothetical protein PS1M3_39420 [Pseudoalteromonas sp. PS1M3]
MQLKTKKLKAGKQTIRLLTVSATLVLMLIIAGNINIRGKLPLEHYACAI